MKKTTMKKTAMGRRKQNMPRRVNMISLKKRLYPLPLDWKASGFSQMP